MCCFLKKNNDFYHSHFFLSDKVISVFSFSVNTNLGVSAGWLLTQKFLFKLEFKMCCETF